MIQTANDSAAILNHITFLTNRVANVRRFRIRTALLVAGISATWIAGAAPQCAGEMPTLTSRQVEANAAISAKNGVIPGHPSPTIANSGKPSAPQPVPLEPGQAWHDNL
ncbi:MAG: hypothetical protein AAF989_13605, partial [Planctomycetota bacterium]